MTEAQKEKVKDLIRGYLQPDLEEISTTADVPGYSTPYAFSKSESDKKKRLKPYLKATGYKLAEDLDNQDLKQVRDMIRKEVASILRDIWIKRAIWAK